MFITLLMWSDLGCSYLESHQDCWTKMIPTRCWGCLVVLTSLCSLLKQDRKEILAVALLSSKRTRHPPQARTGMLSIGSSSSTCF